MVPIKYTKAKMGIVRLRCVMGCSKLMWDICNFTTLTVIVNTLLHVYCTSWKLWIYN